MLLQLLLQAFQMRCLERTFRPLCLHVSSHSLPGIDFSLAKKFGDHLELKLNVRDLLAEKIYYKQFADVTYSDGSKKKVEEIARCYKPGRNIGLQAIYKF